MTRAPLVDGEAGQAVPARRPDRRTTRRSAGASRTRGWRRCSRSSRWARPARTSPSAGASRARIRTRSRCSSQRRWAAAQEAGRFDDELVPVGERRRATSIRGRTRARRSSATLKPAFRAGGTVTAGNSSGHQRRRRGARDRVARRGRASSASSRSAASSARAVAGVDPRVMGIGPVPAVRKLLARAGVDAADARPRRAERGVRLAVRSP